jgi:chaperonin GroES
MADPFAPTQMMGQGMMAPQMASGSGGLPGLAPEAPPQPQMPPGPAPEKDQEGKAADDLAKYLEQVNIAEDLDEKQLEDIGEQVYNGYKLDLDSRIHWEENLDQWTKLALQTKEKKTYPWPNASNIKYPLLATAAMQFSARAYPTLVPGDGKIVRAEVIGADPTGEKQDRAERVSTYMSYQLMKEMVDWDEQMDKLLLILPIVGTCFKKTYYDSIRKKNCSKLVLPKDLVINYWATSIEAAERKTERIEMSKRVMKERQMGQIFLDLDLVAPSLATDRPIIGGATTTGTTPPQEDETTPYIILEQHTFLDLDDDGYEEPYIVTIEERSKKVLRIVARFDHEGIITDDAGELIKIEPVEYYTKYGFIPNPDGGFYDIGFGLLLGPINDSVNTLVNQLIDAGTLSNLQSGFIGKGLRMKLGDTQFKPGEWKTVNATADDIKKQIFPMPVREPSKVLFELLGMLVTASKELASVAEIFVGKMPGQNTPATTTMATIEQGMKVFTAVYKRVYRSLTKELKKIFRLNRLYLDPQEQAKVLDGPIGNGDFDEQNYDVCPAADPTAASQQEKLAKAEALGSLLQLGTLDPMAVTKRLLIAQEQPRPEELLRQGPPPQDPKAAAAQQQAALAQQKAQMDQQDRAHKMAMDEQKAQLEASSKELQMQMESQMQAQEMAHKEAMANLEMRIAQITASQKLQQSTQDHAVKMQQADDNHQLAMKQKKEKVDAKPKPKAKSPK